MCDMDGYDYKRDSLPPKGAKTIEGEKEKKTPLKQKTGGEKKS